MSNAINRELILPKPNAIVCFCQEKLILPPYIIIPLPYFKNSLYSKNIVSWGCFSSLRNYFFRVISRHNCISHLICSKTNKKKQKKKMVQKPLYLFKTEHDCVWYVHNFDGRNVTSSSSWILYFEKMQLNYFFILL